MKGITTKRLSDYPPNCNPYRVNEFDCGVQVTDEIVAMYGLQKGECELIHIPSGRRISVSFD